jgi:hypothetical protein
MPTNARFLKSCAYGSAGDIIVLTDERFKELARVGYVVPIDINGEVELAVKETRETRKRGRPKKNGRTSSGNTNR